MPANTHASTGIEVETGAPLYDFDHVVQSVQTIISTHFGERVMREWVGSPVVALLGQNETKADILNFWSAVSATLDAFEPRVKVRRMEPLSVSRDGRFGFRIVMEYRPRGHRGFLVPESALRAINAAYDKGRWNTQGGRP